MKTIFTLIMVLSVSMSFFLSGMEAGVFALSQLRVRRLVRQGNTNAGLLLRYLSVPEDFLWTIFVGNTLSNFVIVSLVVYAGRDVLRAYPLLFGVAFILGLLLFYAGCELLPKMIFRLYPNRLCLVFAQPFRLIHLLLKPLVALVRWLAAGLMRRSRGRALTGLLFGNRDELRRLMQASAQGLSKEERSMIDRVLDLQSLRVGHVMVPMTKAVTITTQTPVAEALALCRDRGMTRLPVWHEQGGGRRIAGLFNLRTLLYRPEGAPDPARLVNEYVAPASFLDVDARLDEAMRHLQRTGQRLAIVLTRDRRELGIVSLQDILKAIFGQVRL